MSSVSGKKGKKNKGKVLSLQSFLSNGNDTPLGVTQVAKKVRDSDDEDTLPQIYQLPTAPRASRMFDDNTVPHKPPFLAHISNLPFDIKEDDIYDFFEFPLIQVRLPREEGDSGRIRGFGHIEFESRDDLIQAISLPDPHIKNRRVRIDIPNENDQKQNRHYGRNNRYENSGSGFGGNSNENRESTNWRRDGEHREDSRRGYNKNVYNRSTRDSSPDGGSWRSGNRASMEPSPTQNTSRPKDYSGERPKLNLAPRTLPLPEIVQKPEIEETQETNVVEPEPQKVSAEQIFGRAKPVDTASREKEIEDKIEKERKNVNLIEEEDNNMNEKLNDININKDDANKNNWRRRDNNDSGIRRQNVSKPNGGDRRNNDRKTNDYRQNSSANYDKNKEIKNLKKDDKKEKISHPNKPQKQPVVAPTNKYFGLLNDDSDE